MNIFDDMLLSPEDHDLAVSYLGDKGLWRIHHPDEIICADGENPYLYRWYVTPKRPEGLVYLHIQVADDPDRGLHDHPWANQSVILSGGYIEQLQDVPPFSVVKTVQRQKGEVIHRTPYAAHRLLMPRPGQPYTMSLFSTGPRIRNWGFYIDDQWVDYKDVTETVNGVSRWKDPAQKELDLAAH